MIREPMLQFFEYKHLRADLQAYSKPFWVLAHHLCNTVPQNPERTVALRKLLESKDCAVRARLYDQNAGEVLTKPPEDFSLNVSA